MVWDPSGIQMGVSIISWRGTLLFQGKLFSGLDQQGFGPSYFITRNIIIIFCSKDVIQSSQVLGCLQRISTDEVASQLTYVISPLEWIKNIVEGQYILILNFFFFFQNITFSYVKSALDEIGNVMKIHAYLIITLQHSYY